MAFELIFQIQALFPELLLGIKTELQDYHNANLAQEMILIC